MVTIFSFGDSITYGAWDVEGSGWANRLRRSLDERAEIDPNFYSLFYNLGISGETTEGLLRRLRSEVEARTRPSEPENIFIFAYGANDAAFLRTEKIFRVDVQKFAENMRKAIAIARQFSSKIIIVNITPVVKEQAANPPQTNKSRLNEYIESYNKKLKELAEENAFPLVDVFGAFSNQDYARLLDKDDGLHPNNEGHKLIFSLIQKEIEKILI